MKAAFITSLLSALMSLVAVLVCSAMTVVPRAESELHHVMLGLGALFLIWISLAVWLRPRPTPVPLPRWARGLLVFAGVVYVLSILLCVIG